jgi:hypothetical protein
MVWAGYRAKLNHLVLSVLGGIERNVPAFRVDVGYCSLGVAVCCRMHPSLYRGFDSCGDCLLMRSCRWSGSCQVPTARTIHSNKHPPIRPMLCIY